MHEPRRHPALQSPAPVTVAFHQTNMPAGSRVRRCAAVVALCVFTTQVAPRAAVAQDPPGTYDLALDCRTARWKQTLPELATITTRGTLVDVSGKGQFKLDVRHEQPTPLTFACVYDTAGQRVDSAAFQVERGSWTPSGDIASGRTETLRCESTRARQAQCQASIKGAVRIVREYGPTKCEANSNWIWSPGGITVWGGCRAEFEYEAR